MYLVRHGRTDENARGQLQGRLDPHLNETGRRQAEAIAAVVGDVDEVIASPLYRAQETAAYFGKPVETDDRWVEIAYGEYEGISASAVPDEVWRNWYSDMSFATKGGESFGSLDARVRTACGDLADRITDRDIVVVSHVSPIKAAVAWALDTDLQIMFHCHLAQASLCRVGIGRFGPVLHTFNEQASL